MKKILPLLFALVLGAMPTSALSSTYTPTPLQVKVDILSALSRIVPNSDGINLRSGPGMHYEVMEQTSTRKGLFGIPDKTDEEGNDWYKIVLMAHQDGETIYFTPAAPLYIRSDLGRVQTLFDFERDKIAMDVFDIFFNISPQDYSISPFTLDQPLTLIADSDNPVATSFAVPAHTPLLLWSTPLRRGNIVYVPVYESLGDKPINRSGLAQIDDTTIHLLGYLQLEDFEDLFFGINDAAVRTWLREKLAWMRRTSF